MMNLYYYNTKNGGNMFDHLVVGPDMFRGHCTSDAFRRGRSDNVRGVASTVSRGERARWDKNGRRQVRHCRAVMRSV